MSKVDQASWITLSVTITPEDFMEIEDAIAELHWNGGARSGFLEHMVEQYKLKLEESKPSTFAPEDFEFM